MELKFTGLRKFGIAGVVIGILFWFIGDNILSAPNERMAAMIIIGTLAVLYIIGNIVQKKLLNNGGNNNEEVPNGDDPRGPTV